MAYSITTLIGAQPVEEAHILVIHVHVHEPAQAAVVEQAVADAGVVRVEVLDDGLER